MMMKAKVILAIEHLSKSFVLFMVYGFIYFILESLYKTHFTHPLMFIIGGIIGVLIGLINNLFDMDTDFILQCFVGMLLVLLIECVVGYQCNIVNKMAIWDYSKVPFNYVGGQICIPFAIAWFVLSGICIIVDDYLRWRLFGDEKPYYIIINKKF